MVTTADTKTLLNALRERLRPLFDQYESLEHLVLLRAFNDEQWVHDSLLVVKFEGMEEEDVDYSEPVTYRNLSEENSFWFVLYQDYCKLRVLSSEPEGELIRKLGDVLIHREPQKCCKWK